MIKRILAFMIAATVISSCGNTGKKDETAKVVTEGIEIVNFDSLVANTDKYVGRNIVVEGKVVHVCTESGKKLFIVGNNPDVRLYIQAGENMPKFSMDLLGNQVAVEGTINKIGGGEMAMSEHKNNMEAGKTAEGEKKMAMDSCETESALAAQTSLVDVVMDYKSHTVK
jgi:hypothetical protein